MSSTIQQEVEPNDVEPEILGASCPEALQNRFHMRGREAIRDAEATEEDDEDDEEEYHGVIQEPPTPEEQKWCLWLAIVAAVDMWLSGGIFVTSFVFAYRTNGVSLWCMGIQSISHFLSSTMLLLRFCGERSFNMTQTNEEASSAGFLRKSRRRFLVREQIAAMVMGLVMLLSSAGLLFKAFRKIKFWRVWYDDHDDMDKETQWITEFLAWNGFSLYFLQAIFRLIAARKIRRSFVWNTFVASVVSLLFLFLLGFAASYEKEWSWKAEPIAAIALSFVNLAEGLRIVVMHLDDMDTRLRYDPKA